MPLCARRIARLTTAAALVCALGGCSWLFGGDEDEAAGGAPAAGKEPEAMAHPEARFLVHYGGASFRANVRYLDFLGQSVIAFRDGVGEADDEAWPEMDIQAPAGFSRVINFADDGFEPVILDMAETVRREAGVCPGAVAMEMKKRDTGEPRTMYRRARQAWVVFARCPAPGGVQDGAQDGAPGGSPGGAADRAADGVAG
ncbi:MAG: hypothetical protein AAF677_16715 [Pseudomonadota bacterium]